MLVGRASERAVLTGLLERARHGNAGCVVVRGEPGVGKSALVDELVGLAGDALVLRTQGLEVEAPLAFAALHRLLRPLGRRREQLPAPQARALRVAFGEEDGPTVEPFLVAIATLSLLTAAAEEQLVVCLVDDAHWLDPATADALLFCARRVDADRVLLVFAARVDADRPFRPDDIDELVLTGLDPEAARALLDERLGAAPPEEVVDRLVAETGGNPLGLLELPTELSASQLGGATPLPGQLHLTDRVERVFLDRSRQLPTAVQLVLLVAAADDAGDLAVVRAAAADLGADEHAVDAAVASGLLVVDDQVVRVRHPLVRSAIYQADYAGDILPGLGALGLGVGMVFVPVSVSSMAGIPSSPAGVASGFLMTGHEIGAALGVAVLSAVASTAGSLTTSAGAADAFSRGFLGAAVMGGLVAVFALLRMPATRATAAGGMHLH